MLRCLLLNFYYGKNSFNKNIPIVYKSVAVLVARQSQCRDQILFDHFGFTDKAFLPKAQCHGLHFTNDQCLFKILQKNGQASQIW